MLEGNDVLKEHIQTRGLACPTNGLKVFADVGEGLFRVFLIPLGPVLPVEVVVVLNLPCTLKAQVIDILVIDHVEHRA